MKQILLLILIVPLLGLAALGSLIQQSGVQLEVNRQVYNNGLCFGLVVFAGFAGVWIFPTLWNDATDLAGQMKRTLPIQRVTSWTDRHRAVEWECEDDGTVIGYKWLHWTGHEFMSGSIMSSGHNKVLNRRSDSWRGAMNFSDRVPTMQNTSGIYAAKTADSPILDEYQQPDTALVKLRLSGRIIEADYGYRAQKAEIVEIVRHVPPEA